MGGVAPGSTLRPSALARTIWGTMLLGTPRLVLPLLGGRQTRLATTVLRVLGARHVLQAIVTAPRRRRAILVLGAGLDGLHALTALATAATDRSRIRIGLTDAGIATAWMCWDLYDVRDPGVRSSDRQPGGTRRRRRRTVFAQIDRVGRRPGAREPDVSIGGRRSEIRW
jgi:hypothetical protein